MPPEIIANILHLEYPCNPPHLILPWLLDRLGLQIELWPLPDECSGVSIKINGKRYVALNAGHSIRRRRFTLAHEIGHFYCGPEEWRADRFAAALLMPADVIKVLVAKGKDRYKIADALGVSVDAVTVRLNVLGLTA